MHARKIGVERRRRASGDNREFAASTRFRLAPFFDLRVAPSGADQERLVGDGGDDGGGGGDGDSASGRAVAGAARAIFTAAVGDARTLV